MMEWQPIETAPKDGTVILAFVLGASIPSIVSWVTYRRESRWCIEPETFMEDDHFDEFWTATRYEPTHWMPLPTPPK